MPPFSDNPFDLGNPHKVFIVGWYGTETVGDKAILGSIVASYREHSRQIEIIVASLNPFLTRRTILELNERVKVIPVYGSAFLYAAMTSDHIVMGGGPLMDLEELFIPLLAFTVAKIYRRRRIIWCCGLGPLTNKNHLDAVKRIMGLATDVALRDSDSVKFGQQISGRVDIIGSNDPAQSYVQRLSLGKMQDPVEQELIVACFFRDWTYEYSRHLDEQSFENKKRHFERKMGDYLRYLYERYSLVPTLYSMHVFSAGNDDRVFARKFIKEHLDGIPARYEQSPSSVESIIRAMEGARLALCMRFHSVLFAHTLKSPFLAFDYTNGGKIKGFLSDEGSLSQYVDIDTFIENMSFTHLDALISQSLGS